MKRADARTKMLVGGFLVGFLVLAAVAVVFMGDRFGFLKERTRYHAVFGDIAGLKTGAAVKMGGVDIGSVDEIVIEPGEGKPAAKVTLSVFAPHDAMVKQDSQVALETQGVLGDKYVALFPGSNAAPRLAPEGVLTVRQGPALEAVVKKSTDIVDDVSEVTAKLNAFADTLPQGSDMHGMVSDMRGSLKELHSLLGGWNQDGTAVAALRDPATAQRLKRALAHMEAAAAHMESVAAKVDRGQGTLGALVNDTGLYDDMRALLGRANRSKVVRYLVREALAGGEARDDDAGRRETTPHGASPSAPDGASPATRGRTPPESPREKEGGAPPRDGRPPAAVSH